jgi:hypothetical protein
MKPLIHKSDISFDPDHVSTPIELVHDVQDGSQVMVVDL